MPFYEYDQQSLKIEPCLKPGLTITEEMLPFQKYEKLPWSWSHTSASENTKLHHNNLYKPFSKSIYTQYICSSTLFDPPKCPFDHYISTIYINMSPYTIDWPCGCRDPDVFLSDHEDICASSCKAGASVAKLCHCCRLNRSPCGYLQHGDRWFYIAPRRWIPPSPTKKRRLGKRLSLTDRKKYRYGDRRDCNLSK